MCLGDKNKTAKKEKKQNMITRGSFEQTNVLKADGKNKEEKGGLLARSETLAAHW